MKKRFTALKILALTCLFTINSQLYAQLVQHPFEGVLHDERGVPLQGVTITNLENNSKFSSNKDGAFRIYGRTDTISLMFSMMGYRTETRVLRQNEMLKITMFLSQETLQEVEVVSTGYQKLPKERSTGSFIQLGNEALTRQVSTNIAGMLEGTSNALQFDKRGGVTSLLSATIRGRSTIMGNANPLIVVDNFPYEGDINLINPNIIESVSVLKDAAAASIWGTRAGNGVIVIATKKGRKKSKPIFEFNNNLTWGAAPNIHRQQLISSSDFIETEKFLFEKGFYNNQENSASRPVLSPVVEMLIGVRDGIMDATEALDEMERLKQYDIRDDIAKYTYQNALNQQYSFNMRGGAERVAYAFTVGYDDNVDHVGAKDNRLVIRTENTYTPVDNLDVTLGLTYTTAKSSEGRPEFRSHTLGGSKQLYPYARLADDQGVPIAFARQYRQAMLDEAADDGLLDWYYRPLEEYGMISNVAKNNDLLLNTSVTYKLPYGLRAELRYQFQQLKTSTDNLFSQDTWFTRNLINSYSQIVGGEVFRPIPLGDIRNYRYADMQSHAVRGQLAYDTTFNRHNISVIIGGEARSRSTSGSFNRVYGYNDDILSFTPVDYLSLFPQYHWPVSRSRIPDVTSFTGLINRFVSAYANAAYTYDSKYTLSGSIRQDGSNVFGVDANRRFVPLWSGGASWDVSREGFYTSSWLPYLRVRATYGFNGNVDNTLTAYTTFALLNGNWNGQRYGNIQTPPNPNLRWERSAVANFAIDFALAGSRLSGNVEYYRKRGLDLIGEAPIDMTTGVMRPNNRVNFRGNVAEMSGNGVDVELLSKNTTGNLKWNTAYFFSYAMNRVTNYQLEQTSASAYVNAGFGITPIVGKPLNAVFVYRFGGLDPETGNPIGYLEGEETTNYSNIIFGTEPDDLRYIGPAIPPYFGGIRNDFTYRSWGLSLNLTYRLGYYYVRNSINYNALYNNWNGHGDFERRWQQPGDELWTNVPSMVYPNNSNRDAFYTNSEALIERGDNIRIKDIRLNYTFSNLKGLNRIQLYLYANNIGFIWRRGDKRIDPDTGSDIPLPRTVSFGVNATF